MLVEIAVSKVSKYAVRESGDSVEVVERPNGGLSIVMADGQRSGRSAKAISNVAVRKAIALLAEGVRDGSAMRAAHDYLRTQRSAQVSAELTLISVDLETRTLVVSRNSKCPVLLHRPAGINQEAPEWCVLDEPAEAVGVPSRARPVISEHLLQAGQVLVAFTDGVLHAGRRGGTPLDILGLLSGLRETPVMPAQALADLILEAAVEADENRPGDDTTVVVVRIADEGAATGPDVRRLAISFPVPPV